MTTQFSLLRHLLVPSTAALVFATLTANAQPDPFPTINLPAAVNGSAAVRALGNTLPAVARSYGMTTAEFARNLREDPSLWIDRQGRALYIDTGLAETGTDATDTLQTAPYPLSETFNLQSKPDAPRVIYLDFNGHVTTGTAWNNSYGEPIVSPAYDTDGNTEFFSDAELRAIQAMWRQVSEDYAPFDVNVTTRDPGDAAIARSGSGDAFFGTRVIITRDNFAACGCGGFAYLGAFDDTNELLKPAFVFNTGVVGAGEAISHEVGHNFNLTHDGVSGGASYYTGHGSGATGWAPIMGVGYSKSLVQWSAGEYAGANNTQDDLQRIQVYGGPLRPDDYPDSAASAAGLAPTSDGVRASFEVAGLIGTRDDVDVFQLFAGTGSFELIATPTPVAPNLDIELSLFDAGGNLVALSNPESGLSASLSGFLSAGEYTVRIQGVGKGDPAGTGYSDYASLGRYTLSGDVADAGGLVPPQAVATAPDFVGGPAPLYVGFDASASVGAVAWHWDFGDGFAADGELVNHSYDRPGTYAVQLTVLSVDGLSDNDTLSLEVDNLPPVARATSDTTAGTAPLIVSFDGSGSYDPDTGGQVVGYAWDFGDGSTATGAQVQHTYATAGSFSAVLSVVDDLGGESTDVINLEIAAPPYIDQFATADLPGAGSIAGDYRLTTTIDGTTQTITERESGGKPALRHSYLEHSWQFTVAPGSDVTLFVDGAASASTDGDVFEWYAAFNGGPATRLPIVLSGGPASLAAALPSTGGELRLTVKDTDRSVGRRDLDWVAIDALRVRSVSDDGSAGTAPAAPALLAAEALSSTEVELTWEDRSDDEYGFRIRRSTAGGAWQSAGNVGAGETVFVDRDLLPDTGYDYAVVAFNATGESAEATASVTTLAASSIELTANGYKVKGEKTVDLNWQGLSSGTLLRNGVPVFSINGETGYVDSLGKGGGSYSYQVCDDSGDCSNEVTIVF